MGFHQSGVVDSLLDNGYHTEKFPNLSVENTQKFTLCLVTQPLLQMCSQKWSINPKKLKQFLENKLIPSAADEYLCHIIHNEIPWGLKIYGNWAFPADSAQIQLWNTVVNGMLLNAQGRILIHLTQERPLFQWTWQTRCCCVWSADYEYWFVKYKVGTWIRRAKYCHGTMLSTIWERKVLVVGLHKSDTTCSTAGWLKNRRQTLEYRKNYDSYQTGELFVKQVCATNQNSKQNSVLIFILQLNERIIPGFEEAHGVNYQALFLISNSQGHSAYSPDALLVSWMNVGPAKSKPSCGMVGSLVQMATRWHIPWSFPQIILGVWTSQKAIKLCWLNMTCTEKSFGGNAKVSVIPRKMTVATRKFLSNNLTFWRKSHWCRRLLRQWATCIFSSQSFTVN